MRIERRELPPMKDFALAIIRRAFFVQGWLFLGGIPLALAALLNTPEVAIAVLPWGGYVLHLYYKIQHSGEAKITETFPATVRYWVSDRIHLKLLTVNAVVGLVTLLALVGHGHIKL